jgi:hypothetical protein
MLNLHDQERHSSASPEKLAHWLYSINTLYTVRYTPPPLGEVSSNSIHRLWRQPPSSPDETTSVPRWFHQTPVTTLPPFCSGPRSLLQNLCDQERYPTTSPDKLARQYKYSLWYTVCYKTYLAGRMKCCTDRALEAIRNYTSKNLDQRGQEDWFQ